MLPEGHCHTGWNRAAGIPVRFHINPYAPASDRSAAMNILEPYAGTRVRVSPLLLSRRRTGETIIPARVRGYPPPRRPPPSG
ncbi:hypothetical protein ASZ90_010769 [hydrocarbon metagenome]|uniref:Uncharacterized protein n=1 Tax=hydrocarbon metagenome TaxID=938273 RepID=A0A0W8FFM9_9ZZZZ